MSDIRQLELRWRLILGMKKQKRSGLSGGNTGAEERDEELWTKREEIIGSLYDREYGSGRNTRGGENGGGRTGGLEDSNFNVPDWINAVHELFPRKTCERMERDALERYEISEFLTNPEVLGRTTPCQSLLKSILKTKNLMNQEVLAVARELVRKVVKDLMDKLAEEIRQPFSGVKDRNKRSLIKIAQNFNPKETIRRNLKHFDGASRKLIIERPYFYSRRAQRINQWQIIIVVDQSGSMVDSVIHSAVTASIFHGLPFVKQHLVVFDTNVVDLTAESLDAVETLMKVQLGGGTDIGRAMEYARQLVETPERCLIILITDFFEGAPVQNLLTTVHKLISSRVKVLGLAALDYDCVPIYNKEIAEKMVRLGAEVGAMTPGELANWVAKCVGVK